MSHPQVTVLKDNQQVTVILKGSQAEFRSHGPGSDQFAEYLSRLFDQANSPGATKAVLLAKAGLGGEMLRQRELLAEKAQLLKSQGADWDERSRSTTLSPEMKSYLAAKASGAYKAAADIEAELDGRTP